MVITITYLRISVVVVFIISIVALSIAIAAFVKNDEEAKVLEKLSSTMTLASYRNVNGQQTYDMKTRITNTSQKALTNISFNVDWVSANFAALVSISEPSETLKTVTSAQYEIAKTGELLQLGQTLGTGQSVSLFYTLVLIQNYSNVDNLCTETTLKAGGVTYIDKILMGANSQYQRTLTDTSACDEVVTINRGEFPTFEQASTATVTKLSPQGNAVTLTDWKRDEGTGGFKSVNFSVPEGYTALVSFKSQNTTYTVNTVRANSGLLTAPITEIIRGKSSVVLTNFFDRIEVCLFSNTYYIHQSNTILGEFVVSSGTLTINGEVMDISPGNLLLSELATIINRTSGTTFVKAYLYSDATRNFIRIGGINETTVVNTLSTSPQLEFAGYTSANFRPQSVLSFLD
jgi:hypothetical protein